MKRKKLEKKILKLVSEMWKMQNMRIEEVDMKSLTILDIELDLLVEKYVIKEHK